jgi:hypothetical protein
MHYLLVISVNHGNIFSNRDMIKVRHINNDITTVYGLYNLG